jgi:hypothetical protein
MHCQPRAMSPRDWQQRRRKRDLILLGKVLLPHADPTAAGRQRRSHDISERQSRLMPIGDDE